MVDLKDEAGENEGKPTTVLNPQADPFIPASMDYSADSGICAEKSEAGVSQDAVNISDDNEGEVNESETVDTTTEEIGTVMNTATEPHNEPSNGLVKCESNENLDHVENGEPQKSENNVNEAADEPSTEVINIKSGSSSSENGKVVVDISEASQEKEVEQVNESNERVDSSEKSEPQKLEINDDKIIFKHGENVPVESNDSQDKLEAPKIVCMVDAALKEDLQPATVPNVEESTLSESIITDKLENEKPVDVLEAKEFSNDKIKKEDTDKEAKETLVSKVEEPECNISISKSIDNLAPMGGDSEGPQIIDKESRNINVHENRKRECHESIEHPKDDENGQPIVFEGDEIVDDEQENRQLEDRFQKTKLLGDNEPAHDPEPKVPKENEHPLETVKENKVDLIEVVEEKVQQTAPEIHESGDILKNPEAPITAPRRSKMLLETKEKENKKRDSYQATKDEIEESLTFIKSKLNSASPLAIPKIEKEAVNEVTASPAEIVEPPRCSNADTVHDAPGYEPIEAKGSEPLYESIAQEESNKKETADDIQSPNEDCKVEIVSNIVKPGEYSRECIPPVRPERSRKKENLQVPQWTPPKQNIISYLFGCFRPKSE